MKKNHTPGPWQYMGDGLTHRQFDIYAPRRAPQQHICTLNNLPHDRLVLRDPEEALANARLITAAPEMIDSLCHALEALELANREYRRLVGLSDSNTDDNYSTQFHNAIARSMRAIAKATGGAA